MVLVLGQPESSEVKLFKIDEIPWDDLLFQLLRELTISFLKKTEIMFSMKFLNINS